MKRTILFLILFSTIGYVSGQAKNQHLNLIIVIDNDISQDIINGKFIIKDKHSKSIDEMPFRTWVGKLEMTKQDYKKLFSVKPQDTLYLTFENNNFALDTNYIYEGKIPRSMINNRYLIFNIYNKKNKDSREKYIFPENKDYIFQVMSPGLYTKLKIIDKK